MAPPALELEAIAHERRAMIASRSNGSSVPASRIKTSLQQQLRIRSLRPWCTVLVAMLAIVCAVILAALTLEETASQVSANLAQQRGGRRLDVGTGSQGSGSDGLVCDGTQEDLQPCNIASCSGLQLPIDCEFAEWGDWDDCECSGTHQRYRPIAQRAQAGGRLCSGSQRLVESCNPQSAECSATLAVNCVMGDWGDWSFCTKTCQGGQQDRTREILRQPENGGEVCDSSLGETRVCSVEDCPGEEPVDCHWGSWFGWAECTATCGGGEQHRTRVIEVAAKYGGRLCESTNTAERAECAVEACDPTYADCRWSGWDAWSSCSQSCGGGEKYRTRDIVRQNQEGGAGCGGTFENFSACNTEVCPPSGQNCFFGDWQEWASCSATCQGHHQRSRAIAVQAHAGGTPCAGTTMQVNPCNEDSQCEALDVECAYSTWTTWSPCSHSCSGGNQMRRREISTHAQGHGAQCNGDLQELAACRIEPCSDASPVDCEWSQWSDWSMCTATCGLGQFRRHRAVVMEARNGGRPCADGSMVEMGTCSLAACSEQEAICEWETWGPWTDCERAGRTVTCGGGEQKRSRTTHLVEEIVGQGSSDSKVVGSDLESRRLQQTSFAAAVGAQRKLDDVGTKCKEIQDDLQPCAEVACDQVAPVDCVWSAWSVWSSCPCVGEKERHRVIASYEVGGADPCEGAEVEAAPCEAHCENVPSQDCKFGEWTEWSGCPVTCGGSVGDKSAAVRFRTIAQYPLGDGQKCDGKIKDLRPCNLDPCPQALDCRWGLWSAYSACSSTCGGGEKSRSRIIEQVSQNGGRPCNRSVSMEVSKCNVQDCPTEARDCEFSPWADWLDCSVVCGGGEQHRSRAVLVESTEGGGECNGLKQQFRACGTQPCEDQDAKVPCMWGEWSAWSACTALCNGHQERDRVVSQFASNGGPPCEGGERVVMACNTESATCVANRPKDCVVGTWASWTICSHACDGGQASRSRDIEAQPLNFGKPCVGTLFQTMGCNTEACPGNAPVDCAWGSWGDWSACSVTCDGGQHSRHRGIDAEPSAGGKTCEATAAMETGACNIGSCYGSFETCGWSDWGEWVMCSKTCGGGQQERTRQKQWVPTSAGAQDTTSRRLEWEPDRDRCIGSQKATQPCGIQACSGITTPIACEWSSWVEWGPCSCQGLQESERDIGTEAQNNGMQCVGPMRRTNQCTPPSTCTSDQQDCEFSPWSVWSDCTRSCGGGQRYNTRSITTDAAANGIGCQGSKEAVASCNTHPCQVALDCEYADWSPWGACTQSCDGGQQVRSRSIARYASRGGRPCSPDVLEEMGTCNTHPCSAGTPQRVDCTWTLWSEWAACSATCGGGLSSRSHGVMMEAINGGRPCEGVFKDIRNCTDMPCEVDARDCQWAQWNSWSTCSKSCSGHQTRTREIGVQALNLGKLCQGPAQEMRSCLNGDSGCEDVASGSVDCQLSPWTQWSVCSQSCSGGQRETSRVVIRHALGAGKPCGGSVKNIVPCSTDPCPGEEPIDCAWDAWGAFGECTASCDGGEMQRHRQISSEASRGGVPCNASDSTEVAQCNTEPCNTPRYCIWAAWSSWEPCSVTCDGGQKRRHRSFVQASPHEDLDPTQLQTLAENDDVNFGSNQFGVLVAKHRMELCLLATVGAASVFWLATSGWNARQGDHHLTQHTQHENTNLLYTALATEDKWELGDDVDEECPLVTARAVPE